MSVNPFLFTEDDYASPHSAPASNPFLMDDDGSGYSDMGNDNPFLAQTSVVAPAPSTNPFAFDPMDLEPSEADFATTTTTFVNVERQEEGNLDFLGGVSNNEPNLPESQPQKPTDLDLKFTNTVADNSAGPSRPPPPRPPPSKETQDLLMSVMGAMDATSSHLLDKIPPTRTPSPVSMRDLHSPSPTPEPTFGDLLDVSNNAKPQADEDFLSLSQDDINQNTVMPAAVSQQPMAAPMVPQPPNVVSAVPQQPMAPPMMPQQPMMMPQQPMVPQQPMGPQQPMAPPMIPQAPSIVPVVPQQPVPPPIVPQAPVVPPPARPGPPTRPPRPPPAKPPPPVVAQAPLKPPPPTVPVAAQPLPVVEPVQAQNDDMDMFGTSAQPKVATKTDILNLYNKKAEQPPQDLLCDSVEPPPPPPQQEEPLPTPPEQLKEEPPPPEPNYAPPEPLVQDNFVSPEPTDLQQNDTSDSQSKGSVSSVTFNPFAATKENDVAEDALDNNVFIQEPAPVQHQTATPNIFESAPEPYKPPVKMVDNTGFGQVDAFDDKFDSFAQKFESAEHKNGAFDAFAGCGGGGGGGNGDAWGNDAGFGQDSGFSAGFESEGSFDAFLALQEPPVVPQSTPNRISKAGSQESDEDKDFSVFIRPKSNDDYGGGVLPTIAPPPVPVQTAFTDTSPRFNPFDQQNDISAATQPDIALPYGGGEMKRTDSQETPPTPLFDEDVSQPLEPFPGTTYAGEGWEMQLRQPNKKKITGQRFWKKIFVKIVHQADCVLLQLYNQQADKDPFQELPLQPCYSVSEIGAQQYDQFGKIFTVKLQYIFYKERPGVRPGQVKKAERITNKLSQFAAYAIQGDYQGVKEFGSDLKKLGLPVEHAPQVSQLMKIGSLNYDDLKQFSFSIEEALFRLQAHRDRALHYKMEEIQITAVDELYVEQDADGHIEKQIARVRLFFLGFLTGMPDIELGVNDMRRQGKEVVGRHDILPVVTEEWIRLELVEWHSCINVDDYNDTHIIKFKPPDACYIELLRFRVRPPRNRELPLQLKATICVTGNKIELRADVLVPGFASRKLGQIPCEDVMIRFPIPECWIYLFRVEKHFRYGSVKSAHRRTGKIKGIERILGTMDALQESLIEVTSGQAKYEHQHRAIVWRCPRLPKEGQGAYTTHNMVCKLALTSYDQMPDKLAEYCYVEFTMPATQVSHTTCRSVSVQNSDSDEPPEKYVRYLARHQYRVGIEHTEGESPNAYASATAFKKPDPPKEEPAKPAAVPEESSSDSD